MAEQRSLLITGASSGIGRALAQEFAAPGCHLALTGRNRDRLEAVAENCRAAGAEVSPGCIDVREAERLRDWMTEIDGQHPLDLVIANAGISGGTGGGGENDQQLREIFAINVDGVINTVLPAVSLMAARGRGQIALMASLAAFRGFPGAPAYCASKAAVRIWGEALAGSLHGQGIAVSVICPGYVKSSMTDANDFAMPLLMPAEKAAGIIRRGLARGAPRIAFPLRLYLLLRFVAALPPAWTDPLMRRLPEKT